MIRPLPLASLLALLAIGPTACGASKHARVSSQITTAKSSRSTATIAGTSRSAIGDRTASTQKYLNDGDADAATDEDPDDRNGNGVDEDNDYPEDHRHPHNDWYHDADDRSAWSPDRPATAAERRAITTVVERYHAAEATGNGVAACSMIYHPIEASIVEDYGQMGPAYLRADTCHAVLTKLFRHSHSQVDGPVVVTGVYIRAREAIVLLGSATLPAAEISVRREHGAWKVDDLIEGPLI